MTLVRELELISHSVTIVTALENANLDFFFNSEIAGIFSETSAAPREMHDRRKNIHQKITSHLSSMVIHQQHFTFISCLWHSLVRQSKLCGYRLWYSWRDISGQVTHTFSLKKSSHLYLNEPTAFS